MSANRRENWHDRIKAVEREFIAARAAVDNLIAAMESGNAKLPKETEVSDIMQMSENLEATYVIRLYAAFEAGLRSYWATIRRTVPPSRDLINSVAGQHDMPDNFRDCVHEVREFRNAIIHEGESMDESISLQQARSYLQQYFSRLPRQWD